MNNNVFDSDIAGAKTTWILQFQPQSEGNERPVVEFFIPFPQGTPQNERHEWMGVENLKNQKELQKSYLGIVEKFCKVITEGCEKTIKNRKEFTDDSDKIKKCIEDMTALIQKFSETLRRFTEGENEESDDSP